MKLVEAPSSYLIDSLPRPFVFLAGGITNCEEWQDKVVEALFTRNVPGTVFNPRRKNFPIHDPNASREQITWEFKALELCDVFSMWFCDGPSDQPICMYELGRHVARFQMDEGCGPHELVIGVKPGYKREQDVRIQLELAEGIFLEIHNTLEEHIEKIAACMRALGR